MLSESERAPQVHGQMWCKAKANLFPQFGPTMANKSLSKHFLKLGKKLYCMSYDSLTHNQGLKLTLAKLQIQVQISVGEYMCYSPVTFFKLNF